MAIKNKKKLTKKTKAQKIVAVLMFWINLLNLSKATPKIFFDNRQLV